ncbi:MAG: hypothetical protein AB7H88_09875 [Vicinamibacterales bacterium]
MDRLQLRPTVTAAPAGRPLGAPRRWPLRLVALGLLLAAACGAPPTLGHTLPSDEALARAVLDAVAANDREALMALSVSKDEFEDVVWPTLPASRPEVGMPADYVWRDTFDKSRAHLAQTLEAWGGTRFDLVRVEFLGDTTTNDVYTLSRKAVLVVRGPDGQERRLRLFGSVIRQGGGSKVYSYIVD